ncbi:hypothetical protein EON81_28635 [bacterium]|nr:MAG: hypothetical protein EON81_28635 [bacterium]
MKRISLSLALALLVGTILAGCDPKPSVPIAPDVKEPDMSKMTKEDILRMKNSSGSGTNAANTAPR